MVRPIQLTSGRSRRRAAALLGREQEVGAARQHGFAERLAGDEIDGARRLRVRREPVLGGVTLAILLFGAVRPDHELRRQGHDHVVSGRDERRRQHRMIEIGLAVRALARLAARPVNGLPRTAACRERPRGRHAARSEGG